MKRGGSAHDAGRTDFVLLVKFPTPGAVKRRLAVALGDARAAALYRLFVLDMLSAFEQASITPVICFHPPEKAVAVRKWLGPGYRLMAQRGDDHPVRLRHAFEDLFARGADRVVAFASDVPDLPARVIKQAGREIGRSGAVVGPCDDGGYYAIGFNRGSFLPGAFEDVGWSTDRTLYRTVGKLVLAGLRPAMLPRWRDIDTPEDLAGLCDRNWRTAFCHSRTMRYIRGRFQAATRDVGDTGDG